MRTIVALRLSRPLPLEEPLDLHVPRALQVALGFPLLDQLLDLGGRDLRHTPYHEVRDNRWRRQAKGQRDVARAAAIALDLSRKGSFQLFSYFGFGSIPVSESTDGWAYDLHVGVLYDDDGRRTEPSSVRLAIDLQVPDSVFQEADLRDWLIPCREAFFAAAHGLPASWGHVLFRLDLDDLMERRQHRWGVPGEDLVSQRNVDWMMVIAPDTLVRLGGELWLRAQSFEAFELIDHGQGATGAVVQCTRTPQEFDRRASEFIELFGPVMRHASAEEP